MDEVNDQVLIPINLAPQAANQLSRRP